MNQFGCCPSCGAHNVRASRLRGPVERLWSLTGFLPFRCRKCGFRFHTLIWDIRNWRYARCPKCLRSELSTWSEHYYNASGWTRMLLSLGANPWRCEFCRCNFASFRGRRERFSWARRRAGTPEDNAAEPPQA